MGEKSHMQRVMHNEKFHTKDRIRNFANELNFKKFLGMVIDSHYPAHFRKLPLVIFLCSSKKFPQLYETIIKIFFSFQLQVCMSLIFLS